MFLHHFSLEKITIVEDTASDPGARVHGSFIPYHSSSCYQEGPAHLVLPLTETLHNWPT